MLRQAWKSRCGWGGGGGGGGGGDSNTFFFFLKLFGSMSRGNLVNTNLSDKQASKNKFK